MSDVADMLGLSKTQSTIKLNLTDTQPSVDKKDARHKKKPKGMKREVFDLLGPDGLLPAAQAAPITPAFKSKRTTGLKGKWVNDVISSSARADSLALRHWVKADVTYVDYPYSKFNTRLEKLHLTDEEHQSVVDPHWSRAETEELLDICFEFDLRWPVIFDRYPQHHGASGGRSVEDLMARYYGVVQKVRQTRNFVHYNGRDEAAAPFDLEKERKRRLQQDSLFRRTREDELEELKLKEELKNIELLLKKSKKVVKAVAPTNNSAVAAVGESFQPALTDSKGVTLATTTQPVLDVYTGPVPGRPCLQSSRLYLTPANVNLSKGVLTKMNNYLKELGMPDRPLATRAVCDLVDAIRRDTVTLASMTTLVGRKEKDLGTAKSNSGKASSKSGQKSSKPKAPKKPAVGAEGVEVKTEPGVLPLDPEAAEASIGLLDCFDPAGMGDLAVEPQPGVKPKPPPRKRNRSKKPPAAAVVAAAAAAGPPVSEAKLDDSMAVFDDISGLDFDLPASKKSKH